jgi:hypothetical protein
MHFAMRSRINLPCSAMLAALLALFVTCTPALADGKMFSRLEVPTLIPDQEALIAWDAPTSTQTLVIETRFAGPAAEQGLAWVVPVPGGLDPTNPQPPEVFAASPGLFPTLRALFSPVVVRDGPPVFLLLGLVAMVLLCVLFARKVNGRLHPLVAGIVALACVVVVIGFMLPALGKARASAGGGDSVSILSRHRVGAFETTTVASTDPQSLSLWLTDNGFHVPPAAQPVVARYVAHGWVFVCSRLATDAAPGQGGPSSTHPLGFRFRTPAPVYPLALTAVGNGNLAVDLYVFGTGTAEAAGFERIRSGRAEWLDAKTLEPVQTTAQAHWLTRRDERLRFGHAGLAACFPAAKPAWATKLSATLTPAQMAADVTLTFDSGSTFGGAVYTGDAAAAVAANWGVGLFAGGLLVLAILGTRGEASERKARGWVPALLLFSLATSAVTWANLPTAPETVRSAAFRTTRAVWQLGDIFDLVVGGTWPKPGETGPTNDGRAPSLSVVRERLREVLAQWHGHEDAAAIVEIDAPGGYLVREPQPGVYELVGFDAFGQGVTLARCEP